MHKYSSLKVILHTPTCSVKDFKHSELNYVSQITATAFGEQHCENCPPAVKKAKYQLILVLG